MDFQSFFNSIKGDGGETKAGATAPAARLSVDETAVVTKVAPASPVDVPGFPGQIVSGPEVTIAVPGDAEGLVLPAIDPVTIYKGGFGDFGGSLISTSGPYLCYAVRKGPLRAINTATAQNTQLKGLAKDQPQDVSAPPSRVVTATGAVRDRVSGIGADGHLRVWEIDTPEEGATPEAKTVGDFDIGAHLHAWMPENTTSPKVVAVACGTRVALLDVEAGDPDTLPWIEGDAMIEALAFHGCEGLAVANGGHVFLHTISTSGPPTLVPALRALLSFDTPVASLAALPSSGMLVGTQANATLDIFTLDGSYAGDTTSIQATKVQRVRFAGDGDGARQVTFVAASGEHPTLVLVTEGEEIAKSRQPMLSVLALRTEGGVGSAAFFPFRYPVVSVVGEVRDNGELRLNCFQTTRVQFYRIPMADCYTPAALLPDTPVRHTPAAAAPAVAAGDGDSASGIAPQRTNGDADGGAGNVTPPTPPPAEPSVPMQEVEDVPQEAAVPTPTLPPASSAAAPSEELQAMADTVAAQERELVSLRAQLRQRSAAEPANGHGSEAVGPDVRAEVGAAVREALVGHSFGDGASGALDEDALAARMSEVAKRAVEAALPDLLRSALSRTFDGSVAPAIDAAGASILAGLNTSVVRGLVDIRDAAAPDLDGLAREVAALREDIRRLQGTTRTVEQAASPVEVPPPVTAAPGPPSKAETTAKLLSTIQDFARSGDIDGAIATALQSRHLPLLLLTLKLPQISGLGAIPSPVVGEDGNPVTPTCLLPTTQLCLMQQLLMAFRHSVQSQAGQAESKPITSDDGVFLLLPCLLLLIREFKSEDADVREHAPAVLRQIKETMESSMGDRKLSQDIRTKAEIIFLWCRMANSS